MVQSFAKVILVIVCINLLLFVGGVRVIDDNDAFMNKFINVTTYQENEILQESNQLSESIDQPLVRSGTGILEFIDSIGAVTSFITFLLNLIFTPLGLFTGAGLPPIVGLLIGVPLIVILSIGMAYFIRSGS